MNALFHATLRYDNTVESGDIEAPLHLIFLILLSSLLFPLLSSPFHYSTKLSLGFTALLEFDTAALILVNLIPSNLSATELK